MIFYIIRLSAHNIQWFPHNLEEFQQAYTNGDQPGIQYVKPCHNFQPQNTVLLSKNQKDYNAIPGMSEITAHEFLKYVDEAGLYAVTSWSEKNLRDIIMFWKCRDCQQT